MCCNLLEFYIVACRYLIITKILKQNRSVEKTKTLFATDNREKHFSDEQNERVHDKDLCKPRSDEKKSNLLHSKKRDVVSNGHHSSRHSKTPRSSRNCTNLTVSLL